MTMNTERHNELFDYNSFFQDVWLFGLGGSGGAIAECLAGLGVGQEWCRLHLCDPDRFEPHNVPSQLATYLQGEAQCLKVEAVRENLLRTNPHAIIHTYPLEAPCEALPKVSGVVFLCLDSMAARREIIEELLEGNPNVVCVIDIRMDVPGALVYCFNPNDEFQVGCYFDEWYDDDDADEMLGCNDQHFAMRSSILGAACLAMKRFEEFASHDTTSGITNYAKLIYATGYYQQETWINPVLKLDGSVNFP